MKVSQFFCFVVLAILLGWHQGGFAREISLVVFVDGSREVSAPESRTFGDILRTLDNRLSALPEAVRANMTEVKVYGVGVVKYGLILPEYKLEARLLYHFQGRVKLNVLRSVDRLSRKGSIRNTKESWARIRDRVRAEADIPGRCVLFFSRSDDTRDLPQTANAVQNSYFLPFHFDSSSRERISGVVQGAFDDIHRIFWQESWVRVDWLGAGRRERRIGTRSLAFRFEDAVTIACKEAGSKLVEIRAEPSDKSVFAECSFRDKDGQLQSEGRLRDGVYSLEGRFSEPLGNQKVSIILTAEVSEPGVQLRGTGIGPITVVLRTREEALPTVEFLEFPTVVFVGDEVTFQCHTEANSDDLRFHWNFGDGTNDAMQNPSHIYRSTGMLGVALTYGWKEGDQEGELQRRVRVTKVALGAMPEHTVVGQEVPFAAISDGAIELLWDFGDGVTSRLQEPNHTYKEAGNVTASLTAKFPGNREKTVQHRLSVHDVEFSNVPDTVPIGKDVRFAYRTDETAFSPKWDFGDGKGSALRIPTHAYDTVGTKEVSLVLLFPGNVTQTIMKTVTVVPGDEPIADFTYGPDGEADLIAPVTVTFSNQSQNCEIARSEWDFGDGSPRETEENPIHSYRSAGDYDVVLTIWKGREKATKTEKLHIPARTVAEFSYAAEIPGEHLVAPVTLIFSNESKNCDDQTRFEWDFGDGTNLSGERAPEHRYENAGTWSVILNIWRGAQKTGSVTHEIHIGSALAPGPLADFTHSPQGSEELVAPVTVSFTNKLKSYDRFEWDFGDNTVPETISRNPVHEYVESGDYEVVLRVWLGANESEKRVTISISDEEGGSSAFFLVILLAGIALGVWWLLSSRGRPVQVTFCRAGEEVSALKVKRSVSFYKFGCTKRITMFVSCDEETAEIQLEFSSPESARIENVLNREMAVDLSPLVKSLSLPLGEYRIIDTDDSFKVEEVE
ncbi:MAG: PKD domain-containing protein [Verrucomicrobia bacterium]|jgi:PKD repeat protein|nr:PKD domain-containing protein [Verrucomicrobiota bacterium]